MPTKTRIPNKVIYALEESQRHIGRARRWWRKAQERAEEEMDPIQLVALARLRDELAELERLIKDARQGEYLEMDAFEQRPPNGDD